MIVNSRSVSSAVDLLNCFSTLTTVCGSSSRLIQVIFSPDFTVSVSGVKWKSLITIWFFLAPSPASSFSAWPRVKWVRNKKLIANRIRTDLFRAMDVYIDVDFLVEVDLLVEIGIDDGERGLALQILHAG